MPAHTRQHSGLTIPPTWYVSPMAKTDDKTTEPQAPDATTPQAAPADVRDQLISKLQAELQTARDKHDYQQRRAEVAEAAAEGGTKSIEALQAKLKSAKSAPTGDVVSLGGISYPVVQVLQADQHMTQVKQRFLDEGTTLIVIDRKG